MVFPRDSVMLMCSAHGSTDARLAKHLCLIAVRSVKGFSDKNMDESVDVMLYQSHRNVEHGSIWHDILVFAGVVLRLRRICKKSALYSAFCFR